MFQLDKENRIADALSRKEEGLLLWTIHDTEESKARALSEAEWRIWDKIREVTCINARSNEIQELLEAQAKGVFRFKVKDSLM